MKSRAEDAVDVESDERRAWLTFEALIDSSGERRWISFEEACWWIATGSFADPGFGPRPMHELGDDERETEEATLNEGRYSLAREQLIIHIWKGRIDLYGVFELSDADDQSKVRRLYRTISPEEAKNATFYPDRDDGCYWIDGKSFMEFALDLCVIESLFDRRALAAEAAPVFKPLSQHEFPGKSVRGRPRKWDWDILFREIVHLANTPDGLPEQQSQLEDFVAQKAQEIFGAEPSRSMIREKVAPIYHLKHGRQS